MAYLDAHVHVWTDDVAHYPLAPNYSPAQMRPSTFTAEDILGHARPAGVDRIVLVQMSYYGFDNSYLVDTMARHPGVFGGIGVIDHRAPNALDEMDHLGALGVRGFRIQPNQQPAGEWLAHPGFARMFSHAADAEEAICCLINPDALLDLARMCRRFEDTTVIIDHLCRIGADGEIREQDVAALCDMAEFPGVHVKVSAFYALGDKRPPHRDLLPLIEEVFEAFGPRRLMWGSDCPYQVQEETYEDGLAVMRDLFSYHSEHEREWLLSRTAEELFF